MLERYLCSGHGMGNNILNASRLRPETFVLDHMTIQTFYRQNQLHGLFAGEKFLRVAGMSVVCIHELCESGILLTKMSGSDHDAGKRPRARELHDALVSYSVYVGQNCCHLLRRTWSPARTRVIARSPNFAPKNNNKRCGVTTTSERISAFADALLCELILVSFAGGVSCLWDTISNFDNCAPSVHSLKTEDQVCRDIEDHRPERA